MFALLSAARVIAQQAQLKTNEFASVTNVAEFQTRAPIVLRLGQPLDTNSSKYVIMKKKVGIRGPLVRPTKAKSIGDFARRTAQLFSPFTDEINDQTPRAEPVSSRAWSTIVGWNPGRSAFPDDTWHEPQLRLISFSVEKQP